MEVKVHWHLRRVLPLSRAVSVIAASSGRAVCCVFRRWKHKHGEDFPHKAFSLEQYSIQEGIDLMN